LRETNIRRIFSVIILCHFLLSECFLMISSAAATISESSLQEAMIVIESTENTLPACNAERTTFRSKPHHRDKVSHLVVLYQQKAMLEKR